MSEPQNEVPVDTKIQRASERKRAYRIRKKPEDERSEDEQSWYANYEATKRKSDSSPEETPEAQKRKSDSPEETPDTREQEDTEPTPPPPPAPRVSVGKSTEDEQSDGGWKRKYKGGGKDGREKTVLVIASQWRGMLQFMSDQIVLSGGAPMVNIQDIWPYIVLTVDDLLPERVVVKPAHVAAIGTTMLLAQRVVRHKQVREAYERGDHKRESTPEQPPASPPAPETPSAPVPEPPTVESVPPTPIAPIVPLAAFVPVPTEWVPQPGEVV